MSIDVKICGLMDENALDVCVTYGARYIGFVFCKSRHKINVSIAAHLAQRVPQNGAITTVGLFLNPGDAEIDAVLPMVPLGMLQLHGSETPERVSQIKARTGLKVIKAINVATKDDLKIVPSYESVADMLLFDTRIGNTHTGGTGVSFDWEILRGASFAKPWMLAGGLNINNISEAVNTTGTIIIDVSSGVEDASGHKSPAKIQELLQYAQSLEKTLKC